MSVFCVPEKTLLVGDESFCVNVSCTEAYKDYTLISLIFDLLHVLLTYRLLHLKKYSDWHLMAGKQNISVVFVFTWIILPEKAQKQKTYRHHFNRVYLLKGGSGRLCDTRPPRDLDKFYLRSHQVTTILPCNNDITGKSCNILSPDLQDLSVIF